MSDRCGNCCTFPFCERCDSPTQNPCENYQKKEMY